MGSPSAGTFSGTTSSVDRVGKVLWPGSAWPDGVKVAFSVEPIVESGATAAGGLRVGRA